MSWKPHQSIEDTLEFLRRIAGDNASRCSRGCLIFARKEGTLLGSIGGLMEGHRVQFGYLLARDAWVQGFATEAVRAFVAVLLSDPAIVRVQAYCEINNTASAHVLEKAGFVREGTLRSFLQMPNLGPMPRDVFVYVRLRARGPEVVGMLPRPARRVRRSEISVEANGSRVGTIELN
jgi:ribosomal-protein-alanine N-acetyltransferase